VSFKKNTMYQGIKGEHAIPDTSFCRVTSHMPKVLLCTAQNQIIKGIICLKQQAEN